MPYDTKRLTLYGIVGILAALPIIATMTLIPWIELTPSPPSNGAPTFPRIPPDLWEQNPFLTVNIAISNFTEPYGVGSEAEMTVTVTSQRNASEVSVRIDLLEALSSLYPKGVSCISFVDGNTSRSWIVDLQANVSISFTERIKAVDIGFGAAKAEAEWWSASGFGSTHKDSMLVCVWTDGILVTRGPMPGSPIHMAIGYPYLTELQGIGSKFTLHVDMIPSLDIQNVTAKIILPEGFTFIEGNVTCSTFETLLWSEDISANLTWNGDMEENTWMRFNVRINAVKVGNWTIITTAGKYLPDGPWFGDAIVYGYWWYGHAAVWGFQVFEDEITAWEGDPLESPYSPGLQYAKTGVLGKIIMPPIELEISVSDFTEPQGVGSEANLTVFITPLEDISNATSRNILPDGVSYVDGNLTWSGDLKANITVSYTARIKAIRLGVWQVNVAVEKYVLDIDELWHKYHVYGVGFFIIVYENRIMIILPSL